MVECSICYDEILKKSDGTVLLECGHNFCKGCINLWIIEKDTSCSCPNCRTGISDVHKQDAARWGLAHDHYFIGYTNYYYFNVLSEIDTFILLARLPEIIKKGILTDEEFLLIDTTLKDDINYYEILTDLKKSVVVKRNLYLTKMYPDKPEKMHYFVF